MRVVSFLGLFVLAFLAWLMSEDRKRIPWRVVGWGIALQLLFGLVVLNLGIRAMMQWLRWDSVKLRLFLSLLLRVLNQVKTKTRTQ